MPRHEEGTYWQGNCQPSIYRTISHAGNASRYRSLPESLIGVPWWYRVLRLGKRPVHRSKLKVVSRLSRIGGWRFRVPGDRRKGDHHGHV